MQQRPGRSRASSAPTASTANGDVANKIGTYLKALAAHDNGVPFYVALPHSTIDWTLDEGVDIPIEERAADEVLTMTRAHCRTATVVTVEIAAPGTPAAQSGLRRDAGAARHRLHHRARRRARRRAKGCCRSIRASGPIAPLQPLYLAKEGVTGACLSRGASPNGEASRSAKAQTPKKRAARSSRPRCAMSRRGLSPGRSGNVSCRLERRHADHADRHGLRGDRPRDIVFVDGNGAVPGERSASRRASGASISPPIARGPT